MKTIADVLSEIWADTEDMPMAKKLMTETNTPAMERKVLRSAATVLQRKRIDLQADFEHGQWWVTHRPSGAQWSVVDCETQDGQPYFGFEQVTRGEED
jgi:hypothetical protein